MELTNFLKVESIGTPRSSELPGVQSTLAVARQHDRRQIYFPVVPPVRQY